MLIRNVGLAILVAMIVAAPTLGQNFGQDYNGDLSLSVPIPMKFSSAVPLFEPAEVTRTFTKEFRDQLGARLAQDVGFSDVSAQQLTPRSVSFSYSGSDITGMRHATIQLDFVGSWITQENSEELWNELSTKASAGVVEVFAAHLNRLFEEQRQAAREQKQRQRELLQQELDELHVSIEEMQGTSYEVGSSPLKAHIEELAKRLRDDAIRLIELQAQRVAIEKRIDGLRAQAAEQQQEDPLLAALQGEVERLEQALAAMRAELEMNSPLEAAKKLVKVQEGLLQRANRTSGITQAERDQALAQVVQAELRLSEIIADVGSREATMEEKLAQAKIAFLQHQRASSGGRVAVQISKLSDTLDELAIEMDTINGRREGIQKLLARLREDFQQAVNTELDRKHWDSKIHMLEERKAQVAEQLLKLEGETLQPPAAKIEILPVIP